MSGHTKGRLQADAKGRILATVLLSAEIDPHGRGTVLPIFVPASIGGVVDDGTILADARRLAACWNACNGIPTKELHDGSGDLPEVANKLIEQRDALQAERNALSTQLDAAAGALLLSAKIGDLLIVKADGIDAATANNIGNCLRRALPAISGVVFVPQDGDVSTTPADAMRAAGWVRTSMIFDLENELAKARADANRWRAIRELPWAGIEDLWFHLHTAEQRNRGADVASEGLQQQRTSAVDAASAIFRAAVEIGRAMP